MRLLTAPPFFESQAGEMLILWVSLAVTLGVVLPALMVAARADDLGGER